MNNTIVTHNQPGNCLLNCAANLKCRYFVFNEANLLCRLYQGTQAQISGPCLEMLLGFHTGWLQSRAF